MSLRVAGVAAAVACALALGFLLDDGFRAGEDAVERQQAIEAPASVVGPAPAPPVAPAVTPARAEAAEKTGDTAGPRPARRRTEGQRDTRRSKPAPARRRAVPHASEPPPWGRR